jgi:hypothetical protein
MPVERVPFRPEPLVRGHRDDQPAFFTEQIIPDDGQGFFIVFNVFQNIEQRHQIILLRRIMIGKITDGMDVAVIENFQILVRFGIRLERIHFSPFSQEGMQGPEPAADVQDFEIIFLDE